MADVERTLPRSIMNSIKPAISELERAYQAFKPLFPGGMPGDDPVIVIQSSRSPGLLGWLAPHAWKNGRDDGINEITICAEHLARSVEEIAETLLHEMVHHFNNQRRVRDCSASQYHNRFFRDVALDVGMEVERAGYLGWALTRLGPKALAAVQSLNLEQAAFEIFRKKREGKAPTKMRKWSCGCTTVRCATGLEAVCQGCGQRFERADIQATHPVRLGIGLAGRCGYGGGHASPG